ncbi:MAG: MerR family transcriptional regulator [Clostridiales bacterium]|nr:MerR family transcriptional regulator [Clostridiales bacterium]
MLKISDFSKLTHVSVRMLRYYDNQGLLKPEVIDTTNGYRLYSAKQVPELQKIVLLRDLSFSVTEINELLQNWNEDYITKHFEEKIIELQAIIATTNTQIERLKSGIKHINTNQFERCYNVTLRTIPEYPVISLRRKVNDYFDEGQLWEELYSYVQKNHIEIDHTAKNNIAIYHDTEYLDTGIDIEVCIIVKKIGKDQNGFTYRMVEGVEHMACMMVYGPYENIAGAYSSFLEWLEKNEPYNMGSPSRQISIIGGMDTDNPQEYLTEIQIPLLSS